MQKHIYSAIFTGLLVAGFSLNLFAQNVGVATPNPQAPFHVASSGQNTTGGLVVLGDTTEAHLELDFDILQAKYGSDPLLLRIQPEGGDLRVGLDLIHVAALTGFVGIGTNTPTTELHVAGEMQMSTAGFSTSQKDKISIRGILEEQTMLGLGWLKSSAILEGLTGDGSGRQSQSMIDIYEMYYKSEGAHRWFINQIADLSETPMMILNPDGWLGIGPGDPESKLHITGGAGASLTGAGYMQIGTTTSGNLIFDTNEILARSNGNTSTLYLQFWGGDLSLCSNDAGRVGIGNSAPAGKLHITDGSDVSLAAGGELVLGMTTGENVGMDGDEIQARLNGAESALSLQAGGGDLLVCSPTAGRLGVGTLSPQSKLHVTDGGDLNLAGGGEVVLGLTSTDNLALDGNEIQARSNGAASELYLQVSGGQVGIGVSSAANMPAPEYLLAVDGKIISEEVRVELSGMWPDYVFTEEYTLTSLEELEHQIEILGHLPGIPSAITIENEGFELGDMQSRMLEKIEQLTLYMIAANKEIEALKNANTSLEARVMQLQK